MLSLHFQHSHLVEKAKLVQSLHTTLEGPTEYVNARWMQSLHGFLHGTKWIMFHGHMDYSQNPLLEVGLTQYRERSSVLRA